MILLESPYYLKPTTVALYARKNGKYVRPVAGMLIDIRAEDILPYNVDYVNLVGKLPDVSEADQIGRYFLATAAKVDRVDLTIDEANEYAEQGYTMLPHDKTSQYWSYALSPWWEFASIIDEFNGYVKAPKRYRHKEPTPEEIDERIDDFAENVGKLKVISPQTLAKRQPFAKRLQAV